MTWARAESWFDNLWDRIRGENDSLRNEETEPEVVPVDEDASETDGNSQ